MKTLILIDRDGTLIHDEKYYLGSQKDWKKKIKILPHVLRGLKKLNKIDDAGVYMITNQSGIAIKEKPLLTEKRAKEVCQEVMNQLNKKEKTIQGFFICPHVHPDYVKKRKQYSFNKKYVGQCDCIKPALGMVFSALEKEGVELEDTKVYVIGDRMSDVETGINAGGTGVLVPFHKEPGQDEKIMQKYLKRKNILVADTFSQAADMIIKRES